MALTTFHTNSAAQNFTTEKEKILARARRSPKYTVSTSVQFDYASGKESILEILTAEIYSIVSLNDTVSTSTIDYASPQWWQSVVYFNDSGNTRKAVSLLLNQTHSVELTHDYPSGIITSSEFTQRCWFTGLLPLEYTDVPQLNAQYLIVNAKSQTELTQIPTIYGKIDPAFARTSVIEKVATVDFSRPIYINESIVPAALRKNINGAKLTAQRLAASTSKSVSDIALPVFIETGKEFPNADGQADKARIFVYVGGRAITPIDNNSPYTQEKFPSAVMYEISYSEYESNKVLATA